VPCFAGGALCFAGTDSADRIGGGALAIAVGCSCVAEPFRAARRTRDEDAERRIPQERAIEGPAAYPINAPATAPTGPKTTAPDTAPSAASPARSWALASNEVKEMRDPAIRAAASGFFIAIPRVCRDGYATAELRRQRGAGFTLSPISAGSAIENARNGLLRAGFAVISATMPLCP